MQLMKAFCFDPEIAMIYGVDAAVMIWNLDYWIQKNKANERHFHDGLYWTYNTAQAFTELFPFWTAKQITRILAKLEDAGVLHTGNYNPSKYDRTKWYALDYDVLLREKANLNMVDCILPNGQMDLPAIKNGNAQTGETIPNIKQDIFPDSNQIEVTRDARILKGTSEKHLCLFSDSRFSEYDSFAEQFQGDDYAGVDIRYYYEAVKNWSASGGKKKKDWIATARGWIMRDYKEGKLAKVKNTEPGGLEPWQYKEILRQRMNDDESLWSTN